MPFWLNISWKTIFSFPTYVILLQCFSKELLERLRLSYGHIGVIIITTPWKIPRSGPRAIDDFYRPAPRNFGFWVQNSYKKYIDKFIFSIEQAKAAEIETYIQVCLLIYFNGWLSGASQVLPEKKFCIINWSFFRVFGVYFSDFGSTFHSDKSKVYF